MGRKKSMNIVFLDIDGVLNSNSYFASLDKNTPIDEFDDIDETRVGYLEQIVKENKAKIVLSSTWRQLADKSIREEYKLYDYLVHTLGKHCLTIYDKTPIIKMNRPLEIKTWLEANSIDKQGNWRKIRWISLDDDFSYEDYTEYGLQGHLLQTEFFTLNKGDKTEGGLQPKHIALAKQLFDKQK